MMETPVEIDFERCEDNALYRARIEDRVAMLESRLGHVHADVETWGRPSIERDFPFANCPARCPVSRSRDTDNARPV
jgi:hypothetical protein